MADPGKFLRIPMHQGLLESQESSKVPLGFMTELVNWVPEQTGGLRARGKWFKGSETGLPSTRKNRGIGVFNRFTDPSIVQATTTYHATPNSGTLTPALVWPTPTAAGNTLVAVVSVGAHSTGGTATTTFTATGWTARNAIPASMAFNTTATGVYELVTTQSYSGSTTPFTFAINVNGFTVTIIVLELTGVGAFDKLGTATQANATTTPFPLTISTAATTQASELVLAFETAFTHNATTSTVSLASTTTDWAEYLEAAYSGQSNFSGHSTGIYLGTRRVTGTQSITISATHQAATGMELSGAIVTYKGWNTDAVPTVTKNLYLAANDDGTNIDIYAVDDVVTGTYNVVDADVSVSSDNLPIAFTRGLGYIYYTGSKFGGVRRFNGTTGASVATSPVGARCLAISHDRLWAGGGTAIPPRLYYTQLLDGSAWTGTGSGYWDIGTDDGEFIEDITPFNDGLLIGKATSLWFLSGSTTSDFDRHPLPTGGAAPGRSLLTTPFGAVIAGTDQVWLYDGDTVTRLGNAIEVSYGPTGYVTTSYQDGSIYIADPTAGRVYVFNLGGPVGTWRVEECADTIGTLYNVGGRQFMGPYSTTLGSLVNYRDFPAPARGKDYDPLPMSYRMRTGDLWVDGALRPATPRQLYLQLRQRGGTAGDPGLVVTPVFNGVDANDLDVGAENPGTRRVKVHGFPQKTRVGSFGFGITQTLGTGDASVFDIEDAWVEYIQESTL